METNKLSEKFIALVLAMWNTRHIVMCLSDPMHGSTIKATLGLKTQRFDAIMVNLAILAPLSIL
jgi:3-deoxy-D-arabino-heptulosonate 7-phosphate (DAHP) synthase class II